MGERLFKFTSRNHITDRWLRDNPDVMIECWGCGKLIQKDDPRRKFCDRNCAKRYWRAVRKTPLYITCKWCNKEVEAIRSDTLYCSKRCIQSADRERRGIPPLHQEFFCDECGVKFIRTHPPQKYCSFKCFLTHRLRQKKFYNRRTRGSKLSHHKDTEIFVTERDIKEALKALDASGINHADEFNESDWTMRAKEIERRLSEKYSAQTLPSRQFN